jgi:hypothetical protein
MVMAPIPLRLPVSVTSALNEDADATERLEAMATLFLAVTLNGLA